MKKLLIIPVFLLVFAPLFGDSLVEERAKACISENGSDQAGLESCLTKLFVPASMDCDELLEVHRSILMASQGRDDATIRAVARVSSKLGIVSLAANCYSPDVAARLIARTSSVIGGDSVIIADATVSGAVDAASALGVESGSLATSASSSSASGKSGGGSGAIANPPVEIYFDKEVIVSPSGTQG
ncbi:MAG: hypothetical protein O3C43_08480 [Verrucomicrobia bacterium]|nr:hypothetical protein [Verrucomicrobiota bacterium]MDA1066524.1 hypothetical protein [Verrucomicrobiota bacterium]